MRRSTTKPPPPIETWTTEDVHQWLITEVKVQETCADKFCKEDVSGECLADFKKTDILDLRIKHGPAVKITSYLKSLKEGSQHESQFPAYVEKWTKEQVSQWLLQHVNVYSKYAERLQEEDVSGDCLVCFSKQDLLDLAVKSGPAVRILAELGKLNNKPEPTLQPIPHTNTEHKEAPKPTQTEPKPAQTIETTRPEPCRKSELKTDEMLERKSEKDQQTLKETSEKEEIQKPQNLGARRKETTVQPDNSKITVDIEEILQHLSKIDLKKFQFHLQEYDKSKHKRIPRSKLEDKDTMDTAKLMTGHYGSKAQHVTKDILQEIDRRDLVSQLEAKMGQQEQLGPSTDIFKREGNQGDKLKNLMTCGGNSLDNYNRFVVVVNKSSPEQLEYLQFLSKLKLFCVLDFDPNSVAPGGLCHSYRESRVANLHSPSQYQGQTEAVIKGLNLYKQTSWVFCNGRRDLDSDSNKELDYKNWLRRSCRDVEQLVSFICNPEVLIHGRCLVIFLLLSPVETEKDPIFETYRSFIRYTAEENIITICESQSKYFKWRELIQEKCDSDIDCRSINELTLSEINGTITALGPFSQSSRRLLPSSGSSAVVLKQKDEDFMTALDILCLNQCENIYDENSPEFQTFRVKTEEEFYRGGKVKWWNFYISDKDKEKPFVKREKYENVKKMVRSQLRASRNMCDLLTLFHHPGCGATTLAMHVMWDLRQEFRCAVLKDNTLPKTEVAIQVIRLMKLESERPSPVLLLVDDAKATENAHDLVNCIHRAIEDGFNIDAEDSQNCKVIILNCVRSQSPKEQYRKHNPTQSQYITASLTQEEQKEFEKKLKELQETHVKPENFYSFMIMKSNFDQKYIDNLAHNTLESFDFSSKKDQLFAFLALVNTLVSDSEISLSLSEDFLGIKVIRWEKDSVMDTMKPYSNLLIIETVEEWGDYKGIRILHHSIASACLAELERRCSLKVSDITTSILHCDLFFSEGVVKHRFERSIQRMLIERQRKKDGEREPFSPLIEKIHEQQGRQMVHEIFVKASSRFVTSASIPQALARYLYINERDFPEALKWAEKAKNIKEHPHTLDTIGQIHKSNLKNNIDREKREKSCNPENLNTNIKIASKAITVFKRAQELANTEEELEDEAADDESDDYQRKSYTIYGYVGVLEIAFLVFELLTRLPFFEEGDPMKKRYFQSFMGKKFPITSVYKEDNEINKSNMEVIKDHEQFLISLKTEVKETFDTLEDYFTHIKANNSEFDSKNRRTVGGLFKKYVMLFCTSEEMKKEEQQKNPNLNLKMDVEERRLFLEKNQADTFAGILQHLDKPPKEIERITECYAFLQQQQQHQFTNKKQKTRETINYILSNIVLYLLKPKSKLLKSHSQLSTLLQETLQDVGLGYPYPDPYYLALLLLWPKPTEENTEIGTYVTAIRRSSRKRLSKFIPKRSTIAYFYLGKGEGLRRLVSKPKLDENYLPEMARDALAQLWWNGDIFKERGITSCLHRVSGVTEQGQMFAIYGNIKIPVHPARIGGIRPGFSTEKVSFYLGFAINGPLAYDVRYEN